MKFYRYIVLDHKAPSDTNIIWWDSNTDTFKVYDASVDEDDSWVSITVNPETVEKLKNMADDLSSVYQEILIPGEGITIDDNNVISVNVDLSQYKGSVIVYPNNSSRESNKKAYDSIIDADGNILVFVKVGITCYPASAITVTSTSCILDFEGWSALETVNNVTTRKHYGLSLSHDGSVYRTSTSDLSVDNVVSNESSNPVSNKAIKQYVDDVVSNIEIESGYDDTFIRESLIDISEDLNNKVESTIVKFIETPDIGTSIITDLNIQKGTGANSVVQIPSSDTFTNKNTILYPDGNYESVKVDAADYAVAFNNTTRAGGAQSMAQGHRCVTESEASHVEGHCNVILSVGEGYDGYGSHAEGYSNLVLGNYSHAEGSENRVLGNNSHAEGKGTDVRGDFAHTEGYKTFVGDISYAPTRPKEPTGEGSDGGVSNPEDIPTEGTYGVAAHAEGNYTVAAGHYSHAEGRQTDAWGNASHAEGNKTAARGNYSHAEGWVTNAIGEASHAEGQNTRAHQTGSHSEGNNTDAKGAYSHAEGIGTKTKEGIAGQHVEGYYNKETDSLKIIGCGTSDDDRKNAVEVTQDGRVFVKGIGNYDGTSLEAVDLKTSLDNKANSGDVYNKTEINNIINADLVKKNQVATINGKNILEGGNIVITGSGGEGGYDDSVLVAEIERIDGEITELSERIDELGEGGSSVFEATYGETQYADIVEAVKAKKQVICFYNDRVYNLCNYKEGQDAYFTCALSAIYTVMCTASNKWSQSQYNYEITANKVTTINSSSTDLKFPSAKAVYDFVNNTLGTLINGEY